MIGWLVSWFMVSLWCLMPFISWFYWRSTLKKPPTCRKSHTITELFSQSIMKLYHHVILAYYTGVYTNNRTWCIYQRYMHTFIRISIACVYMNHIYEKQIKMCGYTKYRSTCIYERQYGSPVRYCQSLIHSKDWISIRFSSPNCIGTNVSACVQIKLYAMHWNDTL